jgi:hypothetical protein
MKVVRGPKCSLRQHFLWGTKAPLQGRSGVRCRYDLARILLLHVLTLPHAHFSSHVHARAVCCSKRHWLVRVLATSLLSGF